MPTRVPILDEEHAMQFALRLLGFRARSEAELRQRLDRNGYPPHVTDHTLATLMRLNLLDDRDFARGWVASRPGRGPARLKQELRAKGVDRSLAEEVVADGFADDGEFDAALAVACRAARGRELPLEKNELLRVRRLLQRRGFSYTVIGRVCARLNDHLTEDGAWLD